nr:immunoglobulin heavy chain junction region [Mus musculus]
CTPRLAWFAYW